MDAGVVFQPDGPKHRASRKLLHLILQPRELLAYRPTIQKHTTGFLVNLLNQPHEFVQHIRVFVIADYISLKKERVSNLISIYFSVTAGVTLEMSHGYQTQGNHDAYVEMANVTVTNFAYASRIGGHLVDMLPISE